jgi:hypothetical protein
MKEVIPTEEHETDVGCVGSSEERTTIGSEEANMDEEVEEEGEGEEEEEDE